MGTSLKPHIVLSGVNLMDMGPLAILKEALASLSAAYGDDYRITALVHRKSVFSTPGVTYLEFPHIKSSWLRRIRFEYFDCKRLSEDLKPDLWLSMHDITPNVKAKQQAVYCHNPSIFQPFNIHEARVDWKFGMFTLLYRYLYRINIGRNRFVIVQQNWMRNAFRERYGVDRIIVAHPEAKLIRVPSRIGRSQSGISGRQSRKFCYFYPAFPRVFKNLEVILEAVRLLEREGFAELEIWFTTDATGNSYAARLVQSYSDLKSVRWLGALTREQVFDRYAEADCLLFPSRLETWGMPITEFKTTGKPILAADLPYAHETVGEYGSAAFFDPNAPDRLADIMKRAARGLSVFSSTSAVPIAPPFARTWEELWQILLAPERPE